MTRAELNAVLDELCIDEGDEVLFAHPSVTDTLEFYEPFKYENGFVYIRSLSRPDTEYRR